MKKIALITCILALTGCSSLSKTFENRVACTVGGENAVVTSMYGPIGIASKISSEDAAAICKKT